MFTYFYIFYKGNMSEVHAITYNLNPGLQGFYLPFSILYLFFFSHTPGIPVLNSTNNDTN